MINQIIFLKIIKYLDISSLLKIYKFLNLNYDTKIIILKYINKIEFKNRIYWKNNYKTYIIDSLFKHISENQNFLENEVVIWPDNLVSLIQMNINHNNSLLTLCLKQEFNHYNIDQIILMFKNYNLYSLFNDIPPFKLPFLTI